MGLSEVWLEGREQRPVLDLGRHWRVNRCSSVQLGWGAPVLALLQWRGRGQVFVLSPTGCLREEVQKGAGSPGLGLEDAGGCRLHSPRCTEMNTFWLRKADWGASGQPGA